MRQIEFFYFIGSTYSYLSVTCAGDLAAREGVVFDWRPSSVRTLIREQKRAGRGVRSPSTAPGAARPVRAPVPARCLPAPGAQPASRAA